MSVDDLLTTKQVCEQYPVFQPATMRFWRSANQGPASFTLGQRGRVVYRRSEIERWLAEQEQATRRGGDNPPEVA
ncbi:helix-turn-helix domain-containing protein [Mycolicibacterium sp. 141076]|uniref:helix-turn-helix transcriptional regulator n=1 Tax=Mycolicibacterium sp. 141076 TaxID=3090599 RepID=UPI00299EA557|nr:helix-turn-helix domain-containing protein [Mycolicibacterium sp. 141076]MDX1878211.1 helix-turn-helix domain-containing protein [Mycolicibacterium sp. 141076]